jgi:hypothetical protein
MDMESGAAPAQAPATDIADSSQSGMSGTQGSASDSFTFELADSHGEERDDALRILAANDSMQPAPRYEGEEQTVADGAPPLSVSIGLCERRLKGEDQHDSRDVSLNGRLYKIVAIFDGHGGKEASDLCAEKVRGAARRARTRTALALRGRTAARITALAARARLLTST